MVHTLLDGSPDLPYLTFKSELDRQVDTLRRAYVSSGLVLITAADSGQVHATYSRLCSMQDALDRFIDDKSAAGLRALTVTQLSQRIGHFVAFSSNNLLVSVTRAHLHAYVSELVREGRSAKTNKEYVAAVKQWLSWCTERAMLKMNPAAGFLRSLNLKSWRVTAESAGAQASLISYLTVSLGHQRATLFDG
ncbi:site-specific integrase [Grimontia marina]|uniref:Tyrosine recombinase XerC n=1 Tax=Grimontia marina TaxID=646534 RepID=A0A128FIP4_9GAMM|nr:site-specific integrase [Grimontia marina]CZF86184.1 Tyrosine recombinase XerC [Grimontia marina]